MGASYPRRLLRDHPRRRAHRRRGVPLRQVRESKKTRGQPQFVVHTGRPSWHQQQAGHISASSSVFTRRAAADEALAKFQARHPHEPAFIVEQKQR